MAADPATATVVAVTGGLWVLGSIGGTQISLEDFAAATGLSVLGAVTYQFFKAYCAREVEAAKGVPPEKRTTVDFMSMTYACMAAPLATGVLLWLIGILGGTANSLYSIGGFYSAGALAPQIIPMVFTRMLGGLGGSKP